MDEWYIYLYVIGAIIVLTLWILIASEFKEIVVEKGYGYDASKYFWYCFLFGLAGWLMVIALPDKNGKLVIENATPEEKKEELPEI